MDKEKLLILNQVFTTLVIIFNYPNDTVIKEKDPFDFSLVFVFKGSNGKYVTSTNGTANMLCDRATVGSWERFEVISAGTGKVYLKSMGKYVSSENDVKAMICNRTTASTWQAFDRIPNADRTFSLTGGKRPICTIEWGYGRHDLLSPRGQELGKIYVPVDCAQ